MTKGIVPRKVSWMPSKNLMQNVNCNKLYEASHELPTSIILKHYCFGSSKIYGLYMVVTCNIYSFSGEIST